MKKLKVILAMFVLFSMYLSTGKLEAACAIQASGNDMKCRMNSEGDDYCGMWASGSPCSGNVVIMKPPVIEEN